MAHLEINGLPVGTAPGRVILQALPPDYPGLQRLEFETVEEANIVWPRILATHPRLIGAEVME